MGGEEPKLIGQVWHKQLVSFAPYIGFGIIFIMLPLFIPSYFQTMMTKILIFTIFAISLDLIFGYTGLISLGHAAYFGVAAYTTGILILRCGVESFWLAAPAGILMAVLAASVFGVISLRVSGIYFLLVTFALGQLLFWMAWKWRSVTGGDDGLSGIPAPALGPTWLTWNSVYFYYFVLVAFVICFVVLYRIVNSPFGRALVGIRENEHRMRCLGYNVWACKYVAFVLGGLFAGIAGVFFAYFRGFVAPSSLSIETSALVLFMVIIGGAGTLFGSLFGAGILLFLQDFSSIYFPERWPLILGVVFIVVAMYFRGGIIVYLLESWRRVKYWYGSVKG